LAPSDGSSYWKTISKRIQSIRLAENWINSKVVKG
jgi:hypothetical protein